MSKRISTIAVSIFMLFSHNLAKCSLSQDNEGFHGPSGSQLSTEGKVIPSKTLDEFSNVDYIDPEGERSPISTQDNHEVDVTTSEDVNNAARQESFERPPWIHFSPCFQYDEY